MKYSLAALIALALAAVAAADPPKADAKVAVAVVKYDGLTDLIKTNKGKVVVLDFWGHW